LLFCYFYGTGSYYKDILMTDRMNVERNHVQMLAAVAERAVREALVSFKGHLEGALKASLTIDSPEIVAAARGIYDRHRDLESSLMLRSEQGTPPDADKTGEFFAGMGDFRRASDYLDLHRRRTYSVNSHLEQARAALGGLQSPDRFYLTIHPSTGVATFYPDGRLSDSTQVQLHFPLAYGGEADANAFTASVNQLLGQLAVSIEQKLPGRHLDLLGSITRLVGDTLKPPRPASSGQVLDAEQLARDATDGGVCASGPEVSL
jgi:hypothetical protein